VTGKPNRAERVIAFLESRYPGWVPAIELEPVGGRQAWRTAVSEARAIVKGNGDDIENRLQQKMAHAPSCASWQAWDIPNACTCAKEFWTLSEYRLKKRSEMAVPAPAPVEVETQGHDENTWTLRA
jgi:hypothetical protein